MASSIIPQPTESVKASISDQLSEAKVAAWSHQNSYKAVAVNNSSVTAAAAAKQCVRSVRRR